MHPTRVGPRESRAASLGTLAYRRRAPRELLYHLISPSFPQRVYDCLFRACIERNPPPWERIGPLNDFRARPFENPTGARAFNHTSSIE